MRLRIKELREAKGMSQSDLARLLGVSRCTISQWESGCRRPMLSRLPALASALGVEPGDLFETDDGSLMAPGA